MPYRLCTGWGQIIITRGRRNSIRSGFSAGASAGWCEFIIHNGPKDRAQFANEVNKICPDVVDHSTGTVKTLAEEKKKQKGFTYGGTKIAA